MMRDMNQAIAVLDAMHHWSLKCNNSHGLRRNHECTIWNCGRRVSACGQTPLAAIQHAIQKLKEPRRRVKSSPAGWVPSIVTEDA